MFYIVFDIKKSVKYCIFEGGGLVELEFIPKYFFGIYVSKALLTFSFCLTRTLFISSRISTQTGMFRKFLF